MKKWLISIMILIAIGVGVYQWQTKPLTTNGSETSAETRARCLSAVASAMMICVSNCRQLERDNSSASYPTSNGGTYVYPTA